MATVNQSPSGQTSIAISGIDFTDVAASGDPFREPAVRVQDGGPSVAISFGGTSEPSGPTLPTTGQIWPLGVPLGDSTEPAETSSFGWVWWV